MPSGGADTPKSILIDDALRARLDALRPTTATTSIARVTPPSPPLAPLREVLGGAHFETSAGHCWRIETPATIRGVITASRTLIVDIETGGFSGTPVFLIGIADLHHSPALITQWLACDYPQESAILAALADRCAGECTWVTFNGASFDLPFIRDRATLHRVKVTEPTLHVDVMHKARKRWRGQFTDCKLSTLECRVLDRERVGDIPGSLVPDLFHHFIRTGNARPLSGVLEHNRLDLIATAELFGLLTSDEPTP